MKPLYVIDATTLTDDEVLLLSHQGFDVADEVRKRFHFGLTDAAYIAMLGERD